MGTSRSRQGRAYGRAEVEALLHDALATLTGDGTPFRDLSVERLCTAAGIARSTFYLYFRDRTAMLQALAATALLRLYDAQRAWLHRGADVAPTDVRDGMRALVAVYRDDQVVMRAVAEASEYDRAIREAYLAGVQDYVAAVERLIRAGKRTGRFRDVHPAGTAAALAWMTERTVSQLPAEASAAQARAVADALADIVCATLLVDRTAAG